VSALPAAAGFDPIRYKAATAVFKLAVKTEGTGVHRTLNREPKGKGWVPCVNAPEGMLCRPEKVREAIEYFKIAYEVWPDIVALNQIALGYEMIGDASEARDYFGRMLAQAEAEQNDAYVNAARLGLARLGQGAASGP
jgi:tetratricopeptide (TPR) repeat protein